MHLFPHIINRQGGLPFGILEGLEDTPFRETLEQAIHLEESLRLQEKELRGALIVGIKKASKEERKSLKRFLKQIQKKSVLEENLLAYHRGVNTVFDIKKYQREAAIFQNLKQRINAYSIDFAQLLPFLDHEILSKGMHLMSSSLGDRIQTGLNSSKSKKQGRAALTLIKILSRTAGKTVPFSHLGTYGLESELIPITSKVTVNLQVYELFQNAFIKSAKAADCFRLEINPSTSFEDGLIRFLYKNETGEELLQCLELEQWENLNKAFGTGAYLEEIKQLLADKWGEAPKDIADFIGSLLDIGLLQIQFPELGEWMKNLGAILSQKTSFESTLNFLTQAQQLEATFAQLGLGARKEQLEVLSKNLANALYVDFGIPREELNIPAHFLLYEDVFNASQFLGSKSQQILEKTIPELNELLDFLSPEDTKDKLFLEIWNSHFKAEEEVNLLRFYQVFIENDCAIEAETYSHNYKIVIKEGKLQIHFPKGAISENKTQKAAFVQFNGAQLVLNESSIGYGKMLGRILDHLPEKVLQEQLEWNQKGAILLAEIQEQSFFNPNQHPHLTPYQIQLNGKSAGDKTAFTLGSLCLRKERNRINLIHRPSQKRIETLDLGMQSSKERGAFYQFLMHFSRSKRLGMEAVLAAIRQEYAVMIREGIRFVPRLEYKGIILKRKEWVIEKKALSQRRKGQSLGSYILDLNLWQKELALPEWLFVQADGKPLAVNFKIPHLVLLFENLIANSERFNITEMLPSPGALLKQEGQRFATEFLVQWKN